MAANPTHIWVGGKRRALLDFLQYFAVHLSVVVQLRGVGKGSFKSKFVFKIVKLLLNVTKLQRTQNESLFSLILCVTLVLGR